eukprot:14408409-Alexandrium_andersonii.AAC.1
MQYQRWAFCDSIKEPWRDVRGGEQRHGGPRQVHTDTRGVIAGNPQPRSPCDAAGLPRGIG